jgi:phage replication-related protein YjqB (UPF0714/DUF867 family)
MDNRVRRSTPVPRSSVVRSDSVVPDATAYRNYADLATAQLLDRDFRIEVLRRPDSPVAVIAPHGGGIEDGTSELAGAIAGAEFNLYRFEGTRSKHNYRALHLTSHRFDEPQCLRLLSTCRYVIAVHGCRGAGHEVLLGGRDSELRGRILAGVRGAGIAARDEDHEFPAIHPDNVCNRGASRMGVQVEVTHELRRSERARDLAAAIRAVLAALPP